MKKSEIILFTLLLSILEVVGSIKAAGVNTLVESNNLSSVTSHQLIQSSTSENVESEKNNKPILWTPKFQEFKKGDQVKILLPKGKYAGKTSSLKIVYNGKQIGTLNLTNGCDYGIIIFSTDANSGEIAHVIAYFGGKDFGAIGAGGVIDIGGMTGGCTGSTASKAPVAPVIGFSSSSSLNLKSSQSSSSDDEDGKVITRSFPHMNLRSNRSSSSSYNGKGIIIDYGPGPVSIIIPSSSSLKSSSSSSLVSASSTDKDTHRHPGWCPEKSSSRSKSSSTVKSSSSRLSSSSSSLVKSSSSSLTVISSSLKKLPASKNPSATSSAVSSRSSRLNSSTVKNFPVTSSSLLSQSSSQGLLSKLEIPVKTNHFSKKAKPAKVKAKAESHSLRRDTRLSKEQATKRAVRQASQPMIDQNGNLHLNPQQVRTLEHRMPQAAKVAKAVKKTVAQSSPYSSAKASNTSKQGLTLKHRNAAHPVSNVRRVTLPIQGILPATRMDPYTWVYSLVGLAIMIVSGRAFFSKKRK